MRLLHPFAPFITEGIFQKLNEIAPARKLKGLAEAKEAKALVVAQWPKDIDSLQDSDIEQQIENAQLIFFVVGLGVIILAAVVIFLLSRAITRPISALTEGAEVIGKGQLDYSISVETGDEIQQLAEQFNAMARALKGSYANLEEKVKDRTKQERQRVEQLRTINEVSRKISSIVDLD